jgi:DNA-binding transcriptional ArsR family regulator
MDLVFRALSDPSRREILDLLFETDGQTVGELCTHFAGRMSRFGVMKHLGVLEDAALVVALRQGRTKRLFLNPVPIEEVASRWISKYAAHFSSALVELKRDVEKAAEKTPRTETEQPQTG